MLNLVHQKVFCVEMCWLLIEFCKFFSITQAQNSRFRQRLKPGLPEIGRKKTSLYGDSEGQLLVNKPCSCHEGCSHHRMKVCRWETSVGELTSWNDRWLRRDGRLYMRVNCVIVKWSVWEVGGSVVDRCRELMIWCKIFDLLSNRGRVDS